MTSFPITRRDALAGSLAAGIGLPLSGGFALAATLDSAGLQYGPSRPFSFDILKGDAEARAREPFGSLESPYAAILQEIDYNAFFKIVFKKQDSLWVDAPAGAPIQLFHLGRYCKEPCSIGVVEDGTAREILYRQFYFDMPADHVARQLPDNVGFAGFRAMSEDQVWDWMSFLGASYFRTPGSGRQYGMSARGLAIDTGLSSGEEFPRFTQFWLEAVPGSRDAVTVYALLESQSVTGAYRFACTHPGKVVMDVELALYPRKPIQRLGIAPLTSMFWYGEEIRAAAVDWRPEIHDSDGLSMWTGSGERIWRPLNNPASVMTNSFQDENPKGFGFLQRDRAFDHYEDDSVYYNRRPSLWVEPLGSWGKGAVQLVEIPTMDEIHDNVVAYWVPEAPIVPGTPVTLSYRLHWADDEPDPAKIGTVVQNFIGVGGNPGEEHQPANLHRIVVDFRGGRLGEYGPDDGVQAIASASRGAILRHDCYPVQGGSDLFRTVIDLQAAGTEPVDLRLFLQADGAAVTETWLAQYFPDDPRIPKAFQANKM